jgi:hypothetical protein
MSIRPSNSHSSKNPPQAPPLSLPEQRDRKLGPGWRESDASRVGPAIQKPSINLSQSARSDQASFSPASIARAESTNARVVNRADIALPSAYGDQDDAL